ncbi:MAG: hypothetical protein AAF579_08310 [Cyanobacteria bacterium P01_C01_bin.118]
MLTLVFTLIAALYGLFMLLFRVSLPGQMAAIEQLRQDSQNVEANQSHEVISQITKWNQTIAAYKKYRTIWWLKPIFPKDWDYVELIKIPHAR